MKQLANGNNFERLVSKVMKNTSMARLDGII